MKTLLPPLALLWLLLSATLFASAQWMPDILGDGFEMCYVDMPDDYSGRVRSTVVRKLTNDSTTARAVLYVHGFNDYFFQAELADTLVNHGYDFYAVDLRKYGRSLLPENRPFEVRDMKEYFADLDSAVAIIAADTTITEIALMGHSTGGLTASYYMATGNPSSLIKVLILNSPFLDWNLGKTEWLVPAVSAAGALFPRLKIPQDGSTAYAESLLRDHHGEWEYNTEWKKSESPAVTAGWVRAIDRAQKKLRKSDRAIHVPILLMYSDNSVTSSTWDIAHNCGDAVLDVKDIEKYGIRLGSEVTRMQVVGGLHDLFLSRPAVRIPLYRQFLHWLDTHMQ